MKRTRTFTRLVMLLFTYSIITLAKAQPVYTEHEYPVDGNDDKFAIDLIGYYGDLTPPQVVQGPTIEINYHEGIVLLVENSQQNATYVIKTYLNGQLQMGLKAKNVTPFQVMELNYGSLCVLGRFPDGDLVLFAVDTGGNMLWGKSMEFRWARITRNSANNIVLMGGGNSQDIEVVEISGANGNFLNHRRWKAANSSPYKFRPNDLIRHQGSYYLAGVVEGEGFAIKFNGNYEPQWAKSYWYGENSSHGLENIRVIGDHVYSLGSRTQLNDENTIIDYQLTWQKMDVGTGMASNNAVFDFNQNTIRIDGDVINDRYFVQLQNGNGEVALELGTTGHIQNITRFTPYSERGEQGAALDILYEPNYHPSLAFGHLDLNQTPEIQKAPLNLALCHNEEESYDRIDKDLSQNHISFEEVEPRLAPSHIDLEITEGIEMELVCGSYFPWFRDSGTKESVPLHVAFNVYPNPSQGTVQITWEAGLANESDLAVFSLDGKEVLSRTLPAGTSSTTINSLSKGLYQVVWTDGKQQQTQLLKVE